MKDLGKQFVIQEGFEEFEMEKLMAQVDDERETSETLRATHFNRMDFVMKFLKENSSECKDCLDYMGENCRLIIGGWMDSPVMDSECDKSGLRIVNLFDKNYKHHFKMERKELI